MQFIANGPDIPDALLQAHEEGRVIFFCGAGISYPAGLPGFKGLVEDIYAINGTAPTEIDPDFGKLLNEIAGAAPLLAGDARFQRLRDYARQRGL